MPTTCFGWAGEFLMPEHKPRVGVSLQLGFQFGSLMMAFAAHELLGSNADVEGAVMGQGQWRMLSALVSLGAVKALAGALRSECSRLARATAGGGEVVERPRWVAACRPLARMRPVLRTPRRGRAGSPQTSQPCAGPDTGQQAYRR